jgi:ATP-dependent Lon protease
VGGIKQKVLAAARVGIDTVILPQRNEPDLEDIPAEIRDKLHFVFADRVDDVFAAALREGLPKDARSDQSKADRPETGAEDSGFQIEEEEGEDLSDD